MSSLHRILIRSLSHPHTHPILNHERARQWRIITEFNLSTHYQNVKYIKILRQKKNVGNPSRLPFPMDPPLGSAETAEETRNKK